MKTKNEGIIIRPNDQDMELWRDADFLRLLEDRHGTPGLNHDEVKNRIHSKICRMHSDIGL